MYSTTVYLYQQITRVLLIDTSGGYFTARYDPVYAKQLTVNKGVDNVLLFEFINQEQKPVNIKELPQIGGIEPGDLLIVETEDGTNILDFDDLIIRKKIIKSNYFSSKIFFKRF